MDEAEQARAYADADFAEVNQRFVAGFRDAFPDFDTGTIVDLGCGPADIPARLASALCDVRIVGVDAARAMLRLARPRVRVDLVAARLSDLPVRGAAFDACLSNSLVHHLPDPRLFWRTVRVVSKPRAPIFVMDLARPSTREAAREIVLREAGNERAILQRDFFNSLLAAFTTAEVRAQLEEAGLRAFSCDLVSDRHWRVAGRNPERYQG